MASPIFEPHPPNFENQYNFWRCWNDINMIFWFLYWFQISKISVGLCRFLVGYPISLLTPKTTPPCPSKDLQVTVAGTPRSLELNPDLPRPPKRQGPASGSPGGTPDLVLMKSRTTFPAFSGTFGALPRGTPRSTE